MVRPATEDMINERVRQSETDIYKLIEDMQEDIDYLRTELTSVQSENLVLATALSKLIDIVSSQTDKEISDLENYSNVSSY